METNFTRYTPTAGDKVNVDGSNSYCKFERRGKIINV